MTEPILREAPSRDEIEISVFGPGFGECIVAHLGDENWFIIDSCIDRERKKPVALAYLDDIGAQPSAVKQVIVTHWHDDHVGGISDVVRACANAEFWCSDALRTTEFLQLLDADFKRPGLKFTRGVQQLKHVVDAIGHTINFASADQRIFQKKLSLGGQTFPVEIWTLSPSQAERNLARQNFGDLIKYLDGSEKAIPDRNPNHAAVVIGLKIGEIDVLLGSDLEEPGDAKLGWSAVVASTNRPLPFKASLFKVPHHGSRTGHHEDTWTNMTDGSAISAVAPYQLGGEILPEKDDVTRIAALSSRSFITKTRLNQRSIRRGSSIDRLAPKLRRPVEKPGHIRMRRRIDGVDAWTVTLFDGAGNLAEFRN